MQFLTGLVAGGLVTGAATLWHLSDPPPTPGEGTAAATCRAVYEEYARGLEASRSRADAAERRLADATRERDDARHLLRLVEMERSLVLPPATTPADGWHPAPGDRIPAPVVPVPEM